MTASALQRTLGAQVGRAQFEATPTRLMLQASLAMKDGDEERAAALSAEAGRLIAETALSKVHQPTGRCLDWWAREAATNDILEALGEKP